VIAGLPSVHTVAPEITRRERAEGTGVLPVPAKIDRAETRTIPGPAGEIPIRMVVPDDVSGVYLHVHGGGWTFGAADQQGLLLDVIASEVDVASCSGCTTSG